MQFPKVWCHCKDGECCTLGDSYPYFCNNHAHGDRGSSDVGRVPASIAFIPEMPSSWTGCWNGLFMKVRLQRCPSTTRTSTWSTAGIGSSRFTCPYTTSLSLSYLSWARKRTTIVWHNVTSFFPFAYCKWRNMTLKEWWSGVEYGSQMKNKS